MNRMFLSKFSNLEIEGTVLKPIKDIYRKSLQLTSSLMMIDWVLSSEDQEQWKDICLTTSVQYWTGGPTVWSKARLRNRRYTDWKERNGTVSLHRQHNCVWQKSSTVSRPRQRSPRTNEFSLAKSLNITKYTESVIFIYERWAIGNWN